MVTPPAPKTRPQGRNSIGTPGRHDRRPDARGWYKGSKIARGGNRSSRRSSVISERPRTATFPTGPRSNVALVLGTHSVNGGSATTSDFLACGGILDSVFSRMGSLTKDEENSYCLCLAASQMILWRLTKVRLKVEHLNSLEKVSEGQYFGHAECTEPLKCVSWNQGRLLLGGRWFDGWDLFAFIDPTLRGSSRRCIVSFPRWPRRA